MDVICNPRQSCPFLCFTGSFGICWISRTTISKFPFSYKTHFSDSKDNWQCRDVQEAPMSYEKLVQISLRGSYGQVLWLLTFEIIDESVMTQPQLYDR